MENAASGLCAALIESFPGATRTVVVCGPGNNGGDGLAAARRLAGSGQRASVFTLLDPARYAGDAASELGTAAVFGGRAACRSRPGGASRHCPAPSSEADVVVDALFGTGLSRALSGGAARAVRAINRAGRPVVAADVPSGVSSDGGRVEGPAVRASLTVAFGAPKLCHVLPPASGLCGSTRRRRHRHPANGPGGPSAQALAHRSARTSRTLLPPRPLESHKADFGRLAIVAGSRGKAGAAILAARGGLRGGGRPRDRVLRGVARGRGRRRVARGDDVRLAGRRRRDLRGRAGRPAPGAAGFDAVVIGPGLGTAAGTVALLERFLSETRCAVVADADALNAFAGRPGFFGRRRAATILTPHPGEAGRLLAMTAGEIQADRLGAARTISPGARRAVASSRARTRSSLRRRGRGGGQSDGHAAARDGGVGRRARRDSSARCSREASRLARRRSRARGSMAPPRERLARRLGDAGSARPRARGRAAPWRGPRCAGIRARDA